MRVEQHPEKAIGCAVDWRGLHDSRYPVHRIADRLEPYLRAIVDHIRPERIILFGSQVYGQPNEHSDVDLLVVRKSMASERASNLEIMRVLRPVRKRAENFPLPSFPRRPNGSPTGWR